MITFSGNDNGDLTPKTGEDLFLGLDGFHEKKGSSTNNLGEITSYENADIVIITKTNNSSAQILSDNTKTDEVRVIPKILTPDNDYGIDRKLSLLSTKINAAGPIKANGLSQDRINALLSGYTWTLPSSRILTYSFYKDSVFNGSYYGSETGVKEVSNAVKTNVRNALAWLGSVINITFQEVTETASTYGTLRYMLSNAPGYAYCYYPTTDPLGGDVHLNPNYQNTIDTNGFEMPAGNHGYMTLIHETGHGLGLKHPHETPALPTIEDNTSNSVMSYRFTGNSAGTLMAYDLAALQQLYGTKAKEAGNTTYVFSSRIDQFTVNSVSPLTTPTNTKQLIWDTGGSDTLDFSTLAANSGGYRLDINEGGWLTTNAAYQYQVQFYDYNVTQQDITTTYFDWGTSLGYGVTIENLVNSVSADTIYANSAANTFGGYTTGRAVGADVLWNTNSADTLSLAGYTSTGVTRTQVGNDLVIGLGANGSVTVKNYYAGSQINIVYGGVTLPSITLSVSPASVTEDGSANLIYTFTRTGALTSALTVNYTVGGTATNGTDYASIATAVTFATGASTATVTVDPTADATVETNETIALTLAAGTGYTVGTTTAVTGTITDDDVTLPSITLTGTRTRVQEDGSLNLVYTFTRTGSTVDPLVINYTIGGTATMGADYGTIPTSLVFAPDAATATLNVDPFADNIVEADETITLTLATSANYTLGTTTAVTGTITDGNDNVIGTSANDSLDGGAGNDSLYGLAGNDVLNGGIGNDSLIGSVGIDTLTGGTGKDFFVFTTPSQGVDLFTDFRVVDDTIRLSASGFTGLLIGTLAPSAFLSGSGVTSANSTDQRLIYNTTNGALFFDADGSNTVANPIQLATLSNLPVLIPADFLVV